MQPLLLPADLGAARDGRILVARRLVDLLPGGPLQAPREPGRALGEQHCGRHQARREAQGHHDRRDHDFHFRFLSPAPDGWRRRT